MLSTEIRELMVKAYEKSHNAKEVSRNFGTLALLLCNHTKKSGYAITQ